MKAKMETPQEKNLAHPISYRPDIDGLRALAVLAVMAFHAFPSIIQGGFVGVDVFFVISGFLISSILLENINKKRFSIRDFYFRRIKRIFPALLVVLATTLCTGWAILLSDEFIMLGQQTLAATVFSSNFWLWHEAGYFDKSSEVKPLLHLWSLAIEEQFYIVWPLLLLGFTRMTTRVSLCIFLLAATSLFSCIAHINNSTLMFYFPYNRAWELLAGAFLASRVYEKNPLKIKNNHEKALAENSGKPEMLNRFSAYAGIALVLIAITCLDKNSIFPGWLAMIPTLGACMIIAAGEQAWPNRHLLANRIMVFIGLISYPLYLWHWPLLAFARIMEGNEPSVVIRSTCIALSVLLAWLTYYFLERPLRSGGTRTVRILVIAAAAIGISGYFCGNEKIKPRSAMYGLEQIMKAVNDWGYPRTEITAFHFNGVGFDSQGGNKKTTIFIGDSNMEQYLPRINKILSENPAAYNRVIFGTSSGCVPIPHVINSPWEKCPSIIGNAYQLAVENEDIDTIVIAASWIQYFNLGYASPTLFYEEDGAQYPMGEEDSAGEKKALAELERVIIALQNRHKRVFLILNTPVGGEFEPRQLVERSWGQFGFGMNREYTGAAKTEIIRRNKSFTSRLSAIIQKTGIIAFNPVEIMCTGETCPVMTEKGFPIYRDGFHLNATYVKENLSFLDQTVTPRLPTP
jgi:peptidoglycan/LPS O-acetylase OafA/YrhL